MPSDSPPTRERIEYVLPATTLLDDIALPLEAGGSEVAHQRNEEIIVRKLAGFNIPAQITGRNAGPVVTQYEVQPAPDIKVSRIEALADDLAMALAARSLRIEAPIPGKSAVGIEIPNKDFNIVALRRILEEVDFTASGSKLTFALGRDVAGTAQAVDLAKMPHLLIAGATGSGKSVMVNALIASLLCEATPDDVRMILMDLKRVELAAYNGLPHLLVPVITEPERAKAALKWAVNEMEARYRRLAGATARNIKGFNETRADPEDRMPYIVIVVDELADLMMREGKNVEDPIVRLAQKARATGIHMVLATQRPSVNVVTGLIKANFPSRIAFAMASQIDSRTDPRRARRGGPHRPGRHALPAVRPAAPDAPPGRVRVATPRSAAWSATGRTRSTVRTTTSRSPRATRTAVGSVDDLADDDADRLLPDAVEVIREYDRASASLLQRRLKVGYARAARMIDQLEARGYIGAFDGSNARPVLRRDPTPGYDDGCRGPGWGRSMTTRDQLRRATSPRPIGVRRAPAGRREPGRHRAQPARAAVRRAGAQGRRPVPRRTRHEDPGPVPGGPRAGRLQGIAGRRLHEGLPAQLRAVPRARRRRGPRAVAARTRRPSARPRRRRRSRDRIAAPRKGLTFSPFIVVLALMTVGVLAFGAYLGVQLLRFAKPPTIAVTEPPTAVVEVDDDTTSYTLRGVTLPGATVNIATPGRDPYSVTADSTGSWRAEVDLRRGRNQFDVSALDPDTGKHSEETHPASTSPSRSSRSRRPPSPSTSRPKGRRTRTARSRSRAERRTPIRWS